MPTTRGRGLPVEHVEKLKKCASVAATYELAPSGDPNEPRPDPAKSHYNKLAPGKVRDGYIIRIWKPDDVVMHLVTFAVLFQKGYSWATCKIVRAKPGRDDFDFKHYHAKVCTHEEEDDSIKVPADTGANLGTVHVLLHETQGWHDDVWLNLERSYDMGFDEEYFFTYCGKLTSSSMNYARDKNERLMFPNRK